jgi:hypothetical protein
LAVLDLFYDTFKGIGEIGSEFVRVPYVGQKRTDKSSQPTSEAAEEFLSTAPSPAPSSLYSLFSDSNERNEKFVGFRAAKGLGRIVKAAARAPGTFTVAMAQGAHNAPRMWGDKTVRPQEKVTGVVSGVVAGCKVSRRTATFWHGFARVHCVVLAILLTCFCSIYAGTCPRHI